MLKESRNKRFLKFKIYVSGNYYLIQRAFTNNNSKQAKQLVYGIDWTEWHDLHVEMLEWRANLENKKMKQLPIYKRVCNCCRLLELNPMIAIDDDSFYPVVVYKAFDEFFAAIKDLDFPQMMEHK